MVATCACMQHRTSKVCGLWRVFLILSDLWVFLMVAVWPVSYVYNYYAAPSESIPAAAAAEAYWVRNVHLKLLKTTQNKKNPPSSRSQNIYGGGAVPSSFSNFFTQIIGRLEGNGEYIRWGSSDTAVTGRRIYARTGYIPKAVQILRVYVLHWRPLLLRTYAIIIRKNTWYSSQYRYYIIINSNKAHYFNTDSSCFRPHTPFIVLCIS